MKMMLAENIRTFRKERSLTQEQLSKALGATAMDGVDYAINQFDNEELTALWKSLIEQENHHE
ncbi:MAG: hypothetical protein IKQ04_00440 [Oscillospiraceae bacterium]|nr:hypothetical protein [Oscillospiraceae bacterium]